MSQTNKTVLTTVEPVRLDEAAPDVESTVPATDAGRRGGRRPRTAWYGVLALGFITAGFVVSDSIYLFTFNLCLLAAFGAIALDLLKGTAGLISIGNAGFMAVGAFVSIFCQHVGLPFPLDVLVGALAAGIAGVVIGLPALRLRGLHLFLATLAGHFLIVHFAHEYQTKSGGEGTTGFFLTPLYTSKGIQGSQVYWAWTLFVLLSVLVLVVTRLSRERSGRAWRTMRDHEIVAGALGINVTRYKLLAFVISSVIIGFQGGLIAHFTGSVTAEGFTFALAISFVVMVVVGGMDSVAGAITGAAIVTALPILIPNVMDLVLSREDAVAKGPALAMVVYGLLVIVFITSSPEGTIGLVRNARRRVVAALPSLRARQRQRSHRS